MNLCSNVTKFPNAFQSKRKKNEYHAEFASNKIYSIQIEQRKYKMDRFFFCLLIWSHFPNEMRACNFQSINISIGPIIY